MKPICVFLFLVIPLSACTTDGLQDENACILEEIAFDRFYTLKFKTISGGQIYQINQEFTFEGETNVVASFQFQYFTDSLVIRNQMRESSFPHMTVRFEDDRPISVSRYFTASGVHLNHQIDYLSDELLRIDLYRVASDQSVFYVGYADMFFDEANNVERYVHYSVDRNDSTIFYKTVDQSFTYDEFRSPQKGLFLPFFNGANFPEIQFFSANNVLSVTENNQKIDFGYEYGANNSTTVFYQPNADPVQFSYVNCK